MRVRKVVLRRVLLLTLCTELAICLGLIGYFSLAKSKDPPSRAAHITSVAKRPDPRERVPETVNAGLPVRLKIPKINADAALEHVRLTTQGDLQAPKDPANGAWYTEGPRPGDSGNAVINGHFGYRNRIPAIFDDLHTLQPGDKLYVEDEQGTTVAFAVRELRTYGPNEATTDIFLPKDGKEHLNLITCTGSWNKKQESYSARLVVFADKIVE